MGAAFASSLPLLFSKPWWVSQDYSKFGHMAPGVVKGLWFPPFPSLPLLSLPRAHLQSLSPLTQRGYPALLVPPLRVNDLPCFSSHGPCPSAHHAQHHAEGNGLGSVESWAIVAGAGGPWASPFPLWAIVPRLHSKVC